MIVPYNIKIKHYLLTMRAKNAKIPKIEIFKTIREIGKVFMSRVYGYLCVLPWAFFNGERNSNGRI